MSRTSYTFSVLQATAAVASLAIIMWSLGFPVLQFAEAANVTNLSNTLSDSRPSVGADHTIYFETPTGIANGETITIDFTDGSFGIGTVDFEDIDVQEGETDLTVATDCTAAVGDTVGASFTGSVLTITFCGTGTADIAANGSTTIEIGDNATGGAGNEQLVNPAVTGSYQIPVTAGASDSGETRVVILDSVTVTATVDTIFTFSVAGVAGDVLVNTGDTTGGTTTATEIPFGELQDGNASTAAQDLTVSTNASNGFVVTVAADQQLTSAAGDIDGFTDGTFVTTPIAWQSPNGTLAFGENGWGHWGLSSSDTTLTAGLSDLYSGGDNFVSASTTPVEVFRHDGPVDGLGAGEGTARTIYKVEISSLQEAANDYTATLTYVATPVF